MGLWVQRLESEKCRLRNALKSGQIADDLGQSAGRDIALRFRVGFGGFSVQDIGCVGGIRRRCENFCQMRRGGGDFISKQKLIGFRQHGIRRFQKRVGLCDEMGGEAEHSAHGFKQIWLELGKQD